MHGRDKVACTISQLLIYNIYGGTHHDTKTNTIRYGKEHETQFLVYQGLLKKLQGHARLKKQMGSNAHTLGMSVSYVRVMDVKRAIAQAVCKCHADDGVITVVLPTNLRCNVFTTYDVHILDSHNKGRVYGTGLSAPNHMSRENQGEQRAAIQVNFSDKSVPELPNSYALIHPVELGSNPVFVPRSIISQIRPSHSRVQGAKMNDELWMAHVNSVLQHDTLPEDEVITWSVYNSRLMNDDSLTPPAVIGVLPLFPDKTASPSMIKHEMQLTMQGR